MKHRDSRPSPDSGFPIGNRKRIAWVATLLLSGMLANASAQPAPIDAKADASKNDKPAAPANAETGPAYTTPSRYVSVAELKAYVESVSSVFSIKKRTTDPFGQVQDPDAKPKFVPPPTKGIHKPQPVQATPFADIIRLIKVSMVMPDKRFLIGNQSYGQGQRFPVSYRSKNINVEVVSVTSRQITLRNLENGETASIDLNLLPKGMSSGSGKIPTAPGIVRDVPNAPIILDSEPMPFDNSQNR